MKMCQTEMTFVSLCPPVYSVFFNLIAKCLEVSGHGQPWISGLQNLSGIRWLLELTLTSTQYNTIMASLMVFFCSKGVGESRELGNH